MIESEKGGCLRVCLVADINFLHDQVIIHWYGVLYVLSHRGIVFNCVVECILSGKNCEHDTKCVKQEWADGNDEQEVRLQDVFRWAQ